MYECTRRVSFCHKSLLCGHTILMNCTAAAELKPQNARARSFVLAKLLIAAKLRDSL